MLFCLRGLSKSFAHQTFKHTSTPILFSFRYANCFTLILSHFCVFRFRPEKMHSTVLSVLLGLSFSPSALSLTFSSQQAAVTMNGFTYEACYTEATKGRALSGNSYYDDLMTVEKCAIACAKFSHFGVEYGRECFCGNDLNDGSVSTSEADCSFKCPGNSAQTCGAGNRLNLYKKTAGSTTTTTASSQPSASAVPAVFTSKGCYSEPEGARAFYGKVVYDDTLTIESCASACAGFNYFGVEYRRECWCANQLTPGTNTAPAAECNYKCPGDATQSCGGDWRLNVFAFGSPSSTSAPTPAPTGYVSQGCYTDSASSRALNGAQLFDDAMTIEMCSVICNGWALFGVEYGRECFCGNSVTGSNTAAADDCNFPCAGNSKETCGAGNRLNVYSFGSTSSSTTSPLLSVTSSTVSYPSTTVQHCQKDFPGIISY